jgi:type VI secretion system protein ImpC
MPRSSLTSVNIDVSEQPEVVQPVDSKTPFRILIAGDLSAGASRVRKPIGVDRDNFDQVLSLFSPEARLSFGGTETAVRFQELDDFHPDRLFESLPPFRALRDLRERLSDRATFRAAAAQMAAPEAAAEPGPPLPKSGADLLSQMMGESPAPVKRAPQNDWDRMLHEIVAPYAEPKPDQRQPEYIAQTDAAVAGEMRALLHHPQFQALEAAWRGIYFLVRRLETGESLKVYVLDLPFAELASVEGLALLRSVAVEETVRTPGGQPWAVIAGLYEFAEKDEQVLTQIAAIAREARAPFVAGLAPEIVGLHRAFDLLRSSADARWIGLALPRFLLRLPYGEKTDSTERFAFEEMPGKPRHETYLWGNPALACALLLGEAFSRSGWDMRPGELTEITGLPAHVYKQNGEAELKPCAEVLLTEDAATTLLDQGFMPLASIKGSDRVKLVRFQSIASPAASLAGQWD